MISEKAKLTTPPSPSQKRVPERPWNDKEMDMQRGHAVVFACPKGYGFGYLTGQCRMMDDDTYMQEVRLRGGYTFVSDEHITIVPNVGAVMRVIGRC